MPCFSSSHFVQVVLINAVRDVAKALAELIGATKCAAGKPADDPSMYQLKSAAKVNVVCACICDSLFVLKLCEYLAVCKDCSTQSAISVCDHHLSPVLL